MPTHSPFPYETGKLIHTSQDCSEDEISLGLPRWTPNVSVIIIFLINLFKTFFFFKFIYLAKPHDLWDLSCLTRN